MASKLIYYYPKCSNLVDSGKLHSSNIKTCIVKVFEKIKLEHIYSEILAKDKCKGKKENKIIKYTIGRHTIEYNNFTIDYEIKVETIKYSITYSYFC